MIYCTYTLRYNNNDNNNNNKISFLIQEKGKCVSSENITSRNNTIKLKHACIYIILYGVYI